MKALTNFLAAVAKASVRQGRVSVSVLENPASAFRIESEEFVNGLLGSFQVVAAQGFGVELGAQSLEGIRSHVLSVDSLAVLHQEDTLLGFASSKFFKEEGVFYLHGIVVSPLSKGQGGGALLLQTVLEQTNFPMIALTTQNPVMFCLLRRFCREVYPSPLQPLVPQELSWIGNRLVVGRSGRFSETTFVIKELYKRCLYNAIPRSRDEAVNRWFDKTLAVKKGVSRNGFLFVGEKAK